MEWLFLVFIVGPIASILFWLVYRAGRTSMRDDIQRQEDEQMAEADRIMRDDRTVDDVAERLRDGRF